MQQILRRKILDVLNSGCANEWEQKNLRDIYERDTAKPFTLRPRQAAVVDRAHDRIFKGVVKQKKVGSLLTNTCGSFEVKKVGDAFYIHANGVMIPAPIARTFALEVIRYLDEAHKCGGLEKALLALPPPKRKEKKKKEPEPEVDPF